MDYEKKHKEALEWARKNWMEASDVEKKHWEFVFPELRESEGERIRKEINTLYSKIDSCISELLKARIDKDSEAEGKALFKMEGLMVATLQDLSCIEDYLEKQKEQKPVPKFSVGDYVKDTKYRGEPLYQIVGIDKECYICEYRGDNEMGDRAVMHFTFDNPYLRIELQPLMRDGEIEDKKRDIVAAIRKYYPTDYAEYLTSFLKGLSPEDNSEDEYGQEMLGIAYKLMYEHIPENLRTQEFWDSLKFMREYTGRVAIIHSYEKPAEWSEEEIDKMVNKRARKSGTTKTEMCFYRQGIEDTLNSFRPPLKDRDMKLKILKYLSTRCSVLEFEEVEEYLNNLYPHWKPSNEQINHLGYAYTQLKLQKCYAPHVYETLGSLYDDLKKLI